MIAANLAAAKAEALRTAARAFITEMGDAWGGDSQWLTTGTRVAEVVACVLREMADDLIAESAEIVTAIREALESLDDLCAAEERRGDTIRAYEVRGAVDDLRLLLNPPATPGGAS